MDKALNVFAYCIAAVGFVLAFIDLYVPPLKKLLVRLLTAYQEKEGFFGVMKGLLESIAHLVGGFILLALIGWAYDYIAEGLQIIESDGLRSAAVLVVGLIGLACLSSIVVFTLAIVFSVADILFRGFNMMSRGEHPIAAIGLSISVLGLTIQWFSVYKTIMSWL